MASVRVLMLQAATLWAVSVLASVANGAPSPEEYELQERCGKRAEELFRRDWGKEGAHTVSGSHMAVRFRSYYNARLNGCFVLYTVRNLGSSAGTPRTSTQLTLFEANTNKDYGFFFSFDAEPRLMDCWVAQRKCASRQEWDSLATHFIGE